MNLVKSILKGIFKPEPLSPLKSPNDKIPVVSREQIIQEFEDLILQFAGKGEDGGNTNRADYIDEFNACVHMADGSPYCLAALQWARLQLENKHSIIFDLPFLASTQNFYRGVKDQYKFSDPKRGRFAVYKSSLDTNKGHIGTVLSDEVLPNGKFSCFEFNTSGNGSRDGRWQMRKERSLATNGSLILLGFVDYSIAYKPKTNI